MMMTDLEEAGWRKIQPKKVFLEEEKNSIEQEFLGALSNGFTFSVKKDRIELIAIEDSSIKMQLIKK